MSSYLQSPSRICPLTPPRSPPTSPLLRIRRLLSSPLLPIDEHTSGPSPAYPPPDPNLELHSAAASGNVGLVHYALTHGQPVNSVLHGVLPIHAACSGGSVSVVKMLIERGADVNAPRLPRRYSDGKKGNVPSIGAAGSTPLHFAAANGHAGVVQILLTCGAIPCKSDKNGMTPETLAEINGHTDVIRVLRVWEHLKATDPTLSVADGSSYQTSEFDDDESRYASLRSRKGKERAFSFASNVSDSTTGQAVKLKQSLEGMFLRGRSSRSGSIVSTRPEAPPPLVGLDRLSGSAIQDETSPIELSTTLGATIPEGTGLEEEDENGGEALDRVRSAASGSSQPPPLVCVTSEHLVEAEALPTSPRKATVDHLGPAPSRHNPSTSGSSRRPSLPSIFEKAAHPGAAFRAALRREHKDHHTTSQQAVSPTTSAFDESSSPTTAPTSAESSHGHGFFRGRRDSTRSKHGHNKYMSKHALLHLFKRSHSPPSRSPSPPRRDASKPIDSGQIEEGIEKMRRASLDLDLRQSPSIGSDDAVPLRMPLSAPPTKTTFFVDSIIPPPIPPIDPALIPLPRTPTPREPSSPNVRRTRSRQSSDVIAPSPLANEWATSSDSDTPRSIGMIRRAKTEVIKSSSMSQPGSPRVALQDHRTNPPSPLRSPAMRSRAVTSPSTPVGFVMRSASGTKLAGTGWGDPIDLRKVASLRHESMHRLSRRYTGSDLEAFRKSSENASAYGERNEAEGEVQDEEKSTPQASRSDMTPTQADDQDEIEAEAPANDKPAKINGRPSLTVAITEPSYIDLADAPAPRQQGRYRGASVGSASVTTESSRVSTPPGSSLRMSLVTSDDEPKSPTYASYVDDAKSMMPPPPPPSSTGSTGRARGKSVSSASSIPSDMSLSYFNTSTPGTSLTPQSTLSMGRFPPVPEHAVAHHPVNRRKISNRAEAREAKQQAEEDVLQLAQLPVSLDSSRSLAAQLAAYGESVAVEMKFAKREKMDGSEMSYSGSAMSGRSGRSDRSGRSGMSASETEAESWFSANSGGGSSGEGSSRVQSRRKGVPPMADIPPQLLPPANAPKSSLSSIDKIYDKRAAAYRDRMAALTAVPPSFPSSLSSAHRTPRPRTASNESWLTGGASSRQPGWLSPGGASANLDLRYGGAAPSFISATDSLHPSAHTHSHRSKKALAPVGSIHSTSVGSAKAGSISLGTASQSLQSSLPPERAGSTATRPKSTAPAPIADVISTRYAGMSPPPNVPQPPRLDPSSPYVSIFSHRYSGQPLDGDDSDDEEQTSTALTVVENDWRGTRGVPSDEGFERKGRWGQFKGAIGKVGHRKA